MKQFLFGAVLVLVAAFTWAGDRFNVDKSHTRIMFTVDHLGFTDQPGMFREFDVDFIFDREQPENSSLNVTIETASIDMFHDGLNRHLKNEDFFDVEQYPTMTFVSTAIESVNETEARVVGDLTLLGETHPVTFDVTLNNLGPHPMRGTTMAGFQARGTLDRTDWGMDYLAGPLGTDITFHIVTETLLASD